MSLKALYSSATGMDAQQMRINAIANNLANINTVGFKGDRISFEDLMYDQVASPGLKSSSGTSTPVGIQSGHGAKLSSVYKHFSQGDLSQTNKELDLAIEGNGFFQVTLDDGTKAYTRDGSFKVNSSGAIVDSHGYALDPSITVPAEATSLKIGKDGTVSVTVQGQAAAQELGTIQLAVFQNPAGLKAVGQNLFEETDASGTATAATPGQSGAGQLNQGFLENSNVNVAEELVNMIMAQRSYEANTKVMQTSNEMMRSSTNAF